MLLVVPLVLVPANRRAAGEPPALGKAAPRGDPQAAQPVARLIRQLGSPRSAEREAATKRLEEIGEPALDALREAARGSNDAEVQRRAELLVDRLEEAALARLFAEGVRLEMVARDYKRAAAVFDQVIEQGTKRYASGPNASSGDIPFLTKAFLHSARVCRRLGELDKADRAYDRAEYYTSSDPERGRQIMRERSEMIGKLVSAWQEAVRKKMSADPALRKLASEYPLVVLHSRRYAGGRYLQSCYSFLYETADEGKHFNDVQLEFDNGRADCTFTLRMVTGQQNRVADLGSVDFRRDPDSGKVPNVGPGSWQAGECLAVAGHVYLENVADNHGNDFFVLFQVVAVDKDSRYVAFLWRKLPGGKVVRRR
jgi:hypothetical protein